MRICLIAHALQRNDGQGRVNYEVVRRALDAGHHVTIVSMSCADDLAEHAHATWIPIQSETLPSQLLRNIHFANASAKWLRKNRGRFDLIQVNGFVTWEPADLVAVHFVHSAWLQHPFFPFRGPSLHLAHVYQRLYTIMNARWERQAFAASQVVAAVSYRTAREVERLSVTKTPVRVIYNGVDLEEFHPGSSCRQSLGLPEHVPLLAFVGDIRNPRKNLDTVLRALADLAGVHLAVAGEIARSPYPAMAKDLDLEHRVHFLGKTKRVADLFRSADLMVFPSLYEAHPLVVMEAMACGLPAIITAEIGEGETFAASCVLLEDPQDAKGLAGEVRRLLDNPARRRELSASALRTAQGLSWQTCAEGYLALYREITTHPGENLI